MGDDPYLWLEDVRGEAALAIFDSDTRIPGVERQGDRLYNFWQDTDHPRGLWRRTSLEEYRKDSPEWDVVIDVDALAAAEDENWVWAGAGINPPGFTRAVVAPSRGGGDACVAREFDMTTRQFVADGFHLPEAKTEVDFEDDDTWLVSTDFGEGTLTESGYPRLVKGWRRGTALEDAETVFSCATDDIGVGMTCSTEPGFERTLMYRMVDFYNKETFELRDGH